MTLQFLLKRRKRARARPRFRQLRNAVFQFLALTGVVVGLHTLAMMYFEKLGFEDAFWLTMTTIVTVGYGDVAAKTTVGRICTIGLLFTTGIFLAAQTAASWFDYRSARRDAMRTGDWQWDLSGHTLILAPGRGNELFFSRIIAELDLHDETKAGDIVIVSDRFKDGLPSSLAQTVKYTAGAPQEPDVLEAACVGRCAYAIVLTGDPESAVSDGVTFDIVSRIREKNVNCHIIAQVVDDRNRKRIEAINHDYMRIITMRPTFGHPEMIVTALLYPGCNEVMENLFSAAGEKLVYYPGVYTQVSWRDIMAEWLLGDRGIPLAAKLITGEIVTAPHVTSVIHAQGVYVVVSRA